MGSRRRGGGEQKTISQQDAESIIQRITTKKIPEESDLPTPITPKVELTRRDKGTKFGPVIAAVVILLVVALGLFHDSLGRQARSMEIHWLADLLGAPKEEKVAPKPPPKPKETPEQRRKRLFEKRFMQSERMALGEKSS